ASCADTPWPCRRAPLSGVDGLRLPLPRGWWRFASPPASVRLRLTLRVSLRPSSLRHSGVWLVWTHTAQRDPRGRMMSTLEDRPNTALLVVDVQNGVVQGNHERDAVVANVGSLVERAGREEIPVVGAQQPDENFEKGSDEWRIVPELSPNDAEPQVEKSYGD